MTGTFIDMSQVNFISLLNFKVLLVYFIFLVNCFTWAPHQVKVLFDKNCAFTTFFICRMDRLASLRTMVICCENAFMVSLSSSLTSLLTSDDTREAHSFLESDQYYPNTAAPGGRADSIPDI